MAKFNKSGRSRGVLWPIIRRYAGVTPEVPFNITELTLIRPRLMTLDQARQNCIALCAQGELRRIDPGVYCATSKLRPAEQTNKWTKGPRD